MKTNFRSPGKKSINLALGDIRQLPKDLRTALTVRIDESFRAIPKPGIDDWLRVREENGQTFKEFELNKTKAIPHGNCRTIYLQPMGDFNHPRNLSFEIIIDFVRVFYPNCIVELLPIVPFPDDIKYREHDGKRKYATKGLYCYLSRMSHQRIREHELVCVAITTADIYINTVDNWVYGEARRIKGLAVYSFSRLDPLYPLLPLELLSIPITNEHRVVLIRRCVKVLLHELGHLFGLKHCIYYICLMNGSNNEIELDRQPLYLCPVCLRKLYSTFHFDIRDVYQNVSAICEKYGLESERIWYSNRLECILNTNEL